LASLYIAESKVIDLKQPIIDHDLSRAYPDTWAAMERLVGTKTKLIGKQPGAMRIHREY
jgi:hypothetical protein